MLVAESALQKSMSVRAGLQAHAREGLVDDRDGGVPEEGDALFEAFGEGELRAALHGGARD